MHHQVLTQADKLASVVKDAHGHDGRVGPATLRAYAERCERVAVHFRRLAAMKEKAEGPSGFTLPNIFGR